MKGSDTVNIRKLEHASNQRLASDILFVGDKMGINDQFSVEGEIQQ